MTKYILNEGFILNEASQDGSTKMLSEAGTLLSTWQTELAKKCLDPKAEQTVKQLKETCAEAIKLLKGASTIDLAACKTISSKVDKALTEIANFSTSLGFIDGNELTKLTTALTTLRKELSGIKDVNSPEYINAMTAIEEISDLLDGLDVSYAAEAANAIEKLIASIDMISDSGIDIFDADNTQINKTVSNLNSTLRLQKNLLSSTNETDYTKFAADLEQYNKVLETAAKTDGSSQDSGDLNIAGSSSWDAAREKVTDDKEFWGAYFKAGNKDWPQESQFKFVKDMGQAFKQECEVYGFSEQNNPFIYYIKHTIFNNDKQVFDNITAQKYTALHDAVAKNILKATALTENNTPKNSNVIFCRDLFNYSSENIIKYISIQEQCRNIKEKKLADPQAVEQDNRGYAEVATRLKAVDNAKSIMLMLMYKDLAVDAMKVTNATDFSAFDAKTKALTAGDMSQLTLNSITDIKNLYNLISTEKINIKQEQKKWTDTATNTLIEKITTVAKAVSAIKTMIAIVPSKYSDLVAILPKKEQTEDKLVANIPLMREMEKQGKLTGEQAVSIAQKLADTFKDEWEK